ncbi:hypothetical protein SprV_0100138800 [Sparganum proliferum]
MPSVSESYLEKDLATCSHVYLRCDRVRRPLEPPYDGPFRVISRGTKNFRIQRGTREEVVSVDRLKATVPDTPPDEPCGPLPPAPHPRPSIPPSRILPLSPSTTTNLRGHPLKLRVTGAKLDIRKYFFSNRVIEAWNALPTDVAMSTSIEAFKRKLDQCTTTRHNVT